MVALFRFILGYLRHLFNPKVSLFALIASNCKVDKSVVISRGVKIKHSEIGKYSYISAHTDIECAKIGKFCSVADNCRIGMASHTMDFLSTSPIFTLKRNANRVRWSTINVIDPACNCVIIGNDVWVGSHVLIKGGIRIGDGAVIAAGAVVVKDVPPYAIVGGVPSHLIRFRFSPSVIDELSLIKWWDFPDEILCSNIDLFQSEKIDIERLSELKREYEEE